MEILELTPARRLEIYKAALADIRMHTIRMHTNSKGVYNDGICGAIYRVKKVDEPEPCFGGISKNYPELAAYRPAHIESWRDVYWFGFHDYGTQQRVRIMEEIISKMEAV
jgi:hypothetical protein